MYNKNNPCHRVHRGECQCETQNIVTFSGSKINKTIHKKNYMFFEINFTWLIDRLFLSSFTPPLPLPSNPTRFMSSMWFLFTRRCCIQYLPLTRLFKVHFFSPLPRRPPSRPRRLPGSARQIKHWTFISGLCVISTLGHFPSMQAALSGGDACVFDHIRAAAPQMCHVCLTGGTRARPHALLANNGFG